MNILVTGGNGQLGNSLRLAAARGSAAANLACAPGVQISSDQKKWSSEYLDVPAPQRPRAENVSPSFAGPSPSFAGLTGESASASPAAEGNYFSCSCPKNQFPPTDTTPTHADADTAFRFLFTDITEASEESVAMLRKLGGEGVDTSTTRLDITDLEAIRTLVREHHIDAIVNCAAWTNVDGAEDPEKYDLVEKLNATAPENLAVAMKEVGGWLVQISTDYVFGKEPYNTPCKEDQKGTPTGVYGATKLLGEQKIMATGCKYMIIRTAWLYSEFGKNFVRTMLHLTATRPQLKVVFDQTGTPTYAGDLASAIMAILSSFANPHSSFVGQAGESSSASPAAAPDRSAANYFSCNCPKNQFTASHTTPSNDAAGSANIFHFSNEGVCSWYDFAKTIYAMAREINPSFVGTPSSSAAPLPSFAGTPSSFAGSTGESPDCDIQPCHSEEFPSPVKRPAYSVLDKTKIKSTFGLSIPYWTDSLRRCLTALL
jgi:dTDP-4-dehydrorhamnose reductase